MGTLNNNAGGQRHDGQKNYQHSNQRNPDNIRNATRDHEYKEHDETLTNDANFDPDMHQAKTDMEFDDKGMNVDKHRHEE
ncbi:hypothetical protein [Flavobacterium sp.]|uniref:hypothetical protein n=1 Tax=Flavobacterium sp. TaxID=239 RepID=UPI0039E49B46